MKENRPLKIAHVVCTFPPYRGGIGNSAFEFSKRLAASGHSVSVFVPDYQGDGRVETIDKLEVIRLKPTMKMGNAALLPKLIFKLKDFDIVHLHYPFFGGAEMVWLAKKAGLLPGKLVVQFHMDVAKLSPLAEALRFPDRMIRKSLFSTADAVIASSEDYAQHSSLADYLPNLGARFHALPFGIDVKRFCPEENKRTTGMVNFLFVGGLDRAHYFKGVANLLSALARLKDKDWRLRVVGKGDMREDYIIMAKDLDIGDKVDFWDNIGNEELPAVYRQSDVFILPSINSNEAFGIVLLEAMASGLPVIASALPGVRSVFEDGKQGLAVRPGDIDDLAKKIIHLIENRGVAAMMGKAGRGLAMERYSWEKVMGKLEDIYNKIISYE